jgi:hypothetical protein
MKRKEGPERRGYRRPSVVPSDLPPADAPAWSALSKTRALLAIRQGVITRQEAHRRYQLSTEELNAWESAFDRDGIAGLMVTKRDKPAKIHHLDIIRTDVLLHALGGLAASPVDPPARGGSIETPRWLIDAIKDIARRGAAPGEVLRLAERSGRDPRTLNTLISRVRRTGRVPDYWGESGELSSANREQAATGGASSLMDRRDRGQREE